MKLPIIKAKSAHEDIVSIGIYFEQQSPVLTNNFLASLTKTLGTIAAFPNIGRVYNDIESCELRTLQIRNFKRLLIFYRVLEKEIEIIRIIHTARDIPHLLDDLTD